MEKLLGQANLLNIEQLLWMKFKCELFDVFWFNKVNKLKAECTCTYYVLRCQWKLDWNCLRYEFGYSSCNCTAPRNCGARSTTLSDIYCSPKFCYQGLLIHIIHKNKFKLNFLTYVVYIFGDWFIKVTLSEKFLVSVCSEYNHVRTWSVTRFRGMISTQPGSTPVASFKILSLEEVEPCISYCAGNDCGK